MFHAIEVLVACIFYLIEELVASMFYLGIQHSSTSYNTNPEGTYWVASDHMRTYFRPSLFVLQPVPFSRAKYLECERFAPKTELQFALKGLLLRRTRVNRASVQTKTYLFTYFY